MERDAFKARGKHIYLRLVGKLKVQGLKREEENVVCLSIVLHGAIVFSVYGHI